MRWLIAGGAAVLLGLGALTWQLRTSATAASEADREARPGDVRGSRRRVEPMVSAHAASPAAEAVLKAAPLPARDPVVPDEHASAPPMTAPPEKIPFEVARRDAERAEFRAGRKAEKRAWKLAREQDPSLSHAEFRRRWRERTRARP